MKTKLKNCLECGKALIEGQKDFCSRECCIDWVNSLRKMRKEANND